MYRTTLVLILAAAPLAAQQVPARPALPPDSTLAPASRARPAIAGRLDAQREAAAAQRDAQREAVAARMDIEREAIAAQRDAMRESQEMQREQLSAARMAEMDALRESRVLAVRPAIAAGSLDLDVRPFPMPSINLDVRPFALAGPGFGAGLGAGFGGAYGPKAPQGWAPQDPADSLYRQAQQAMNRGDYRRAASLFKDLPVKQPNSVYASDALYWEAFSLYRIGGSTELQEALTVLDARKNKYPVGRSRGDADPALATRIAGVLAARGMGDKELVKRALTEGGNVCDTEDQSVRAEALNALRQTDPDEALAQAKKILGRKDDCSVQLRRSALWMIANKKDAGATATLVTVAKTDPSVDLRAEATGFLGSMPGDEALAALEELLKSDDDRVQRAAVRALTVYPNPRARTAMHALIENNGAAEQLRITALDAFDRDRSTLDDASWLRRIYPKIAGARIKGRIVSAVARIGGEQNEQWLLSLAKNEDESIEVRSNALNFVARTADIASLGKFYDGASARPLREEIISALGNRKEPEATDKLIEIARSGTDPDVRRSAINTLARKKDPRTTKLLLDLISGDSQGKKP
jgi:HEAT repeat protein